VKGDSFPIIWVARDRYDRDYNYLNRINYNSLGVEDELFEPDLRNWEEIKEMTYREYIYKQLEMYNFFNPETVE
jgi:hypothetical protein